MLGFEQVQEHKTQQEQERAEVGSAWMDSGLVFTRPDGSPIHPDLITDWFRRLARAASLPPIRLHDVRHSYATAALAAGVPGQGGQRAPGPSPWTSTATSFPAWTPRPLTPWPA
jgi:integrase